MSLKKSKFPPIEKRLKPKKKLLLIWVKLSLVRIGSVSKRVRFGSTLGSGCPFLVHFGSGHYGGFELGQVISGAGHFGSYYKSGFIRFWISLLQVFRSKSVHPISGVSSGMDPGRSVLVSGLGSVLSGLTRVDHTYQISTLP